MKYRKDIDGLRAIAVLLVVFDHIKIPHFEGGFLGVDIFFTISGFLITSILIGKLQSNSFSFQEFYAKRIKRIFPVLVFVLLVATIINIKLLYPEQLKEYFSFLPYTVFGLGNIAATNLETGYFDQSAERHQLLHTWSLGVEEQFYLLIPLLLFLLWKIKSTKTRETVILLILMFSTLLSLIFVQFTDFSKSNYYLLHTRFFEIFIGVTLAVFYEKLPRFKMPFLSSLATLFLVFALVFLSIYFDSDTPWPGLNAFWVVLSTSMLIYFGGKSTKNIVSDKWLGNPFMVFVGRISYSLYLWHWIFISLAIEMGFDFVQISIFDKLLFLFFFLIPVSYLSWKYVENTFRYNKEVSLKASLIKWVAVPALVSIGLLWLQSNNEELFYNTEEIDQTTYRYITSTPHYVVQNINETTKELSSNFNRNEILIGDFNTKDKVITHTDVLNSEVLILGNSHFNAFKHFIDYQLKEIGYVGHVMEERTVNVYSSKNAEKIYSQLLENKKYLLIIVRHSGEKFGDTNIDWREWLIKEAMKNGVTPIVMVPSIEIESDAEARRNIYAKKIFDIRLNREKELFPLLQNIQNITQVENLYSNYKNSVRWLDFKPLMYSNGSFNLWLDDEFILFDDNHLTRKAGMQLGREYSIRYGNIFSSDWEQTPIMMSNLFYSKSNNYNYFSDTYNIYSDGMFTISKLKGIGKIKIRKKYSPISDEKSNFFLHLFPKNFQDLPERRKEIGFDNINCKKEFLKTFIGQEKLLTGEFKVPNYEIDSILIGHYTSDGKRMLDLKFKW
ncbi:acyltransferase family protein [uncultured Croceitalea sp.]|uniref:acyltransferase family protein n=1 Tax=uncultured Croceitalea sp. TaxID=1798908 RepID=UPI0033057C6D